MESISKVEHHVFESAVEDFFNEIDALGPSSSLPHLGLDLPPPPPPPPPPVPQLGTVKGSDALVEPVTSWQMVYDEQSGNPFYWNKETNESKWTPPDEYLRYIDEFNAYQQQIALQDISTPPPSPAAENNPPRKSVEYLSEYIAYSSSGGSSSDESKKQPHGTKIQSSNERKISNRKRRSDTDGTLLKRQRTKINVDAPNVKSQSLSPNKDTDDHTIGPQLPDRIIGPTLPPGISSPSAAYTTYYEGANRELSSDNNSESGTENTTGLTKSKNMFIGPVMPSSANLSVDNDDSAGVDEINRYDMSTFQTTIIESSQLILDKLTFLDVTEASLSWLQVLCIQLLTRLEDWKAGYLSTEYMATQLASAQNKMTRYEEEAIPVGWACYWSSEEKRYYYENQITGDTQWDFPTDSAAPNAHSMENGKDAESQKSTKTEKEDGEIEDDEKRSKSASNKRSKHKKSKTKKKKSKDPDKVSRKRKSSTSKPDKPRSSSKTKEVQDSETVATSAKDSEPISKKPTIAIPVVELDTRTSHSPPSIDDLPSQPPLASIPSNIDKPISSPKPKIASLFGLVSYSDDDNDSSSTDGETETVAVIKSSELSESSPSVPTALEGSFIAPIRDTECATIESNPMDGLVSQYSRTDSDVSSSAPSPSPSPTPSHALPHVAPISPPPLPVHLLLDRSDSVSESDESNLPPSDAIDSATHVESCQVPQTEEFDLACQVPQTEEFDLVCQVPQTEEFDLACQVPLTEEFDMASDSPASTEEVVVLVSTATSTSPPSSSLRRHKSSTIKSAPTPVITISSSPCLVSEVVESTCLISNQNSEIVGELEEKKVQSDDVNASSLKSKKKKPNRTKLLGKRGIDSLVQKWEKVQHDVTDSSSKSKN